LPTSFEVLTAAAQLNGLDPTGAELIRDGSHAMYRLNDQIVARIGQPGSESSAEREVFVSRWLTQQQYPVTQLASGLLQPTVITDRPVTWWRLISEHRPAAPAELGEMLRMLHALPVPEDLGLPFLDPFCELAERIDSAPKISEMEHNWLAERHRELLQQYRDIELMIEFGSSMEMHGKETL
jgi:hypothetical protein